MTLPMKVDDRGRKLYEVSPGRFVTRQRVHQLGFSAAQARIRRPIEEVRAIERERMRRRRQAFLDAGRCAQCGQEPHQPQATMCVQCLGRNREKAQRWRDARRTK